MRHIVLFGAVTLAAAPASAAVTHPAFSFRVSADGVAGGGVASDFGSVQQTGVNEWLFSGAYLATPGTSLSWTYLVDPDPFVTGTFTMTNETAAARDYVVDFSLPIAPALSACLLSGQVAGTLTDANGSGSALLTSVGGGFVYSALADDAFVQGLMANASHQVSTANGTSSFSGGSFGFPTPVRGPAINLTIGIRFSFSLSAGDSVSFSSVFVANPVPGPATLMVAATFAAIGRRRRTS
jgi:hypothetical protein